MPKEFEPFFRDKDFVCYIDDAGFTLIKLGGYRFRNGRYHWHVKPDKIAFLNTHWVKNYHQGHVDTEEEARNKIRSFYPIWTNMED